MKRTTPTKEETFDALRRAAGLKEIAPPPWYKRVARFYDENWEEMFDGVGVSIFFLACLLLFLVILVQMGRATGWWGGAW